MGAGCNAPLAGSATLAGDTLTMTALVGAPDGRCVRVARQGPIAEAATIGRAAADALTQEGGATLLAEALAAGTPDA